METGEVMSPGAAVVRPDAPIVDALKIMLEHRISGLPVVDSAGRLVGVVTEGDFVRSKGAAGRPIDVLLRGGQGVAAELNSKKVKEIMTAEPVSVSADAPLEDAVRLMEAHNVKRLPVVRQGKVVGMVSRSNLLLGLLRKYRLDS